MNQSVPPSYALGETPEECTGKSCYPTVLSFNNHAYIVTFTLGESDCGGDGYRIENVYLSVIDDAGFSRSQALSNDEQNGLLEDPEFLRKARRAIQFDFEGLQRGL